MKKNIFFVFCLTCISLFSSNVYSFVDECDTIFMDDVIEDIHQEQAQENKQDKPITSWLEHCIYKPSTVTIHEEICPYCLQSVDDFDYNYHGHYYHYGCYQSTLHEKESNTTAEELGLPAKIIFSTAFCAAIGIIAYNMITQK